MAKVINDVGRNISLVAPLLRIGRDGLRGRFGGSARVWLRTERDRVLPESLRTFGINAARTLATQAIALHEVIRDECSPAEGPADVAPDLVPRAVERRYFVNGYKSR